jgi:hypothetical protein
LSTCTEGQQLKKKYTDVSDDPAASIIRIGAIMQAIRCQIPGDISLICIAVSARNVTNSGRRIYYSEFSANGISRYAVDFRSMNANVYKREYLQTAQQTLYMLCSGSHLHRRYSMYFMTVHTIRFSLFLFFVRKVPGSNSVHLFGSPV